MHPRASKVRVLGAETGLVELHNMTFSIKRRYQCRLAICKVSEGTSEFLGFYSLCEGAAVIVNWWKAFSMLLDLLPTIRPPATIIFEGELTNPLCLSSSVVFSELQYSALKLLAIIVTSPH
jgi:hypothetical protein